MGEADVDRVARGTELGARLPQFHHLAEQPPLGPKEPSCSCPHGGIDERQRIRFRRPTSALDTHAGSLADHFREHPPAPIKEACQGTRTFSTRELH